MIIWNKYIKAHKEAMGAAKIIDWVKKRIKNNKNNKITKKN
jgi:hypothetical protein